MFTEEDLKIIDNGLEVLADVFRSKYDEEWTKPDGSVIPQFFWVSQYFLAKKIYLSAPSPSKAETIIQDALIHAKKVVLKERENNETL